MRDKKRAEFGNASVSEEEEHEEAEAGANRTKKSTAGRSIDVDRYRDKKTLSSRLAILSARRVFASPRFSSNRADDGYYRLACPECTCTCRGYRGITRKVLADGHCRSLAAWQEEAETSFASRDVDVMPSRLRYVG